MVQRISMSQHDPMAAAVVHTTAFALATTAMILIVFSHEKSSMRMYKHAACVTGSTHGAFSFYNE